MINGKRIIAVIPARKGSKRLKNKNILKILNKPLIYWTIISALKSEFIEDIVVSTDSDAIIDIASRLSKKIIIIRRPKHLARSTTKTFKVVEHVFKILKQKKKLDHSLYILLQPTSPLRHYKIIDDSIKFFLKKKSALSLVSVFKNSYSNKNNITIDKYGYLKNGFNYQHKKKNITINGAIYISHVKKILDTKGFFENKCISYFMKENLSIDIDTIDDFKHASLKLKQKNIISNFRIK